MVEIQGFFGVRQRFKGQGLITKDELFRFFAEKDPELKDSTLRWRIYHLKENGILIQVKRGVYSLTSKEQFNPEVSKTIKKIDSTFSFNFSPSIRSVIWSTAWLHSLMVQQPAGHLIILETEKEWTEPLFQLLQEKWRNIYLNPDHDNIRNYVLGQKEAIIVKPLISRSPTQGAKYDLELPTLEKMLVDVFCEKDLFLSYQGSELEHIFENAWNRYAMNLSALLTYAQRRKRGKAIRAFLKRIPDRELQKLVAK